MEQTWAERVRDECKEAEVSFFMKQMSATTPEEGKKLIPAELFIHEYPK